MSNPVESRSATWCFTYNNYPVDALDTLDRGLRDHGATQFTFQQEVGESGTPHLQGVVRFRVRRRLSWLRANLPTTIHWERCRSWAHSVEYCRKPSFDGAQRRDHGLPRVPRIISELRPWQSDIVEKCRQEPDDRTINWIWDSVGNTGKTALCRYLVTKSDEFGGVLMVAGKAADIKYGISKWVEGGKPLAIVLWNIPRGDIVNFDYAGAEQVKDGLFYNTKYESGMVNIASPHVFIFANQPPDRLRLSEDRWNIIDLE